MHTIAYYHSPIGHLLLKADSAAIVAILFCEEEPPIGESEIAHPLLRQGIQQLDEYFAGKRKTFDLPLQQPGTSFQQKAWDILHTIPYGKTISYMDMAKQYGEVKAIRALASANGKNNIAIVVPCHRVIGSNGSLTGYASGLWRKKWLLEHEAKHHSGVQLLDL